MQSGVFRSCFITRVRASRAVPALASVSTPRPSRSLIASIAPIRRPRPRPHRPDRACVARPRRPADPAASRPPWHTGSLAGRSHAICARHLTGSGRCMPGPTSRDGGRSQIRRNGTSQTVMQVASTVKKVTPATVNSLGHRASSTAALQGRKAPCVDLEGRRILYE